MDEKPRRLVEFKDGCKYGRFGRTLAYRLIAEGKITAGPQDDDRPQHR